MIITFAVIRRRADRIVFDLGYLPGYGMVLLSGTVFLLIALDHLFTDLLSSGLSLEAIGATLIYLSTGCFFVLQGLRRSEIRERGFVYQWLIVWSTIRAYQWDPDKPTTLTLYVQARVPFMARHHFMIPVESRDAVSTLLRELAVPVAMSKQFSVTSS